MYSFIFRFILGVLALVGVARTSKVFKEPKETRDKRLLNFFYFFLFLALHQFAWGIPFNWFTNYNVATFWLYETAIAFYFLLLFFSLKTLSLVFKNTKILNTNCLGKITLAAGAIVIVSQFFWFSAPVIKSGFVIWQTDIYTSLINGLFGFLTAAAWVFMLYKNMPQTGKAKPILLALGSFSLGLSCLVFFIFKTPIASIASFILIFLGITLGLISFYWPKKV